MSSNRWITDLLLGPKLNKNNEISCALCVLEYSENTSNPGLIMKKWHYLQFGDYWAIKCPVLDAFNHIVVDIPFNRNENTINDIVVIIVEHSIYLIWCLAYNHLRDNWIISIIISCVH